MVKTKYKVFLLVLSFIALPIHAENDTVHTFSLNLHTLSDLDTFSLKDTEYSADLLWTPEIYGSPGNSEIVFKPVFIFPVESSGEVAADIKELKVSIFPADNLEFKVGRFIDDSSFAAFFSKTAFSRAVDYQELLEGNLGSAAIPSWLMEGTLYIGNWYIRAKAESFMDDLPFFSPDSIWFPNLGFPEVIPSPFAPDGEIRLEEIRIAEPEPRNSLDRLIDVFGASLELGGRAGPFDFLMNLYSGKDNMPLFSAEIIFKNLVDDYSVELHPIDKRITGFGAAVRTAAGPVVLYAEGALSLNKPFIKETFYSTTTGFETESYTSNYFGATLGGRWELWEANLLIAAEYTNGYILNEASYTVMPFFQQMALASVIWTPLDRRLICSITGVAALEDNSTAVNGSIEYAPGEGKFSVKLSIPLFFGSADSSFGQYSNILYPAFSTSIRF